MQSVGGPTVNKTSCGSFKGGASLQGGVAVAGFDSFLIELKQKRRAVLTLLNCMQSVGESNPCYQDENLAS